LGLAGGAVLVLALAQAVLPEVAARRISSRLGHYGVVKSVRVDAWPAVKLLWGSADSVQVRAVSLRVSPAQTARLLWESRGVNDLRMVAHSVQEGPLRLRDVSLRKSGRALAAGAWISRADVRAALPPAVDVQLSGSEAGRVTVRASGGLFGVGAPVGVVAGARAGRLVAHPQGSRIEGLALTLFADPHIYVEGVGASRAAGPEGRGTLTGRPAQLGYRLTITASVR